MYNFGLYNIPKLRVSVNIFSERICLRNFYVIRITIFGTGDQKNHGSPYNPIEIRWGKGTHDSPVS